MRNYVIVFLFILPTLLCAQPLSIKGVVVDAETKQRLKNATVFINQSLNSTNTDSAGNYTLQNISDHSFKVVAALKGYTTLTYLATPVKQLSTITFELKKSIDTVKAYNLNDFNKFSFLFLYNLLGGSKNAAECELLNPEVLRFYYDEASMELSVEAIEPLQIINEGLGFLITYHLDSFVVTQEKKSIQSGYFFFKNLTSKREEILGKWQQRRIEAYNGSLNHFLKSVYNNTIEKDGFELHNVKRVFAGDPEFTNSRKTKDFTVFNRGSVNINGVTKTFANLIDRRILSIDSIRNVDTSTKKCSFIYKGILQVIYKKELEEPQYLQQVTGAPVATKQSSFLQLRDKISIQPSGLFYETDDLFISGYLNWEKLGDLLPFEYLNEQ